MTVYTLIFYLLAAGIIASTGMAVTRKNLVHVVLYLVIGFFGSALLFYLLGAPLLAALEVIVYAGAIMILFLFIIMMLRMEAPDARIFHPGQWLPALVIGGVFLASLTYLLVTDAPVSRELTLATVSPEELGHYLFRSHWLAIEVVSLLLLIALIGAQHLGGILKKERRKTDDRTL
jgi:NADH-quinone oxidoreductase subunit J